MMIKPASKRVRLYVNKGILMDVNIYCNSMHTGEYSQSQPESKSDLREKF